MADDPREKPVEAPPTMTVGGKELPTLADGAYDAIVLGTGLKECIISGLLAKKGACVSSPSLLILLLWVVVVVVAVVAPPPTFTWFCLFVFVWLSRRHARVALGPQRLLRRRVRVVEPHGWYCLVVAWVVAWVNGGDSPCPRDLLLVLLVLLLS